MNPEITKIIDQYLQGELSESDRIVFEKRLAESDILQKEVAFQKAVYEGAKRAAIRTKVKQTGKSYHFTKKIQIAGISLMIAAVTAALSLFVSHYFKANKSEISEEILALMDKLEKESPIEDLKSEFFIWNGTDATVLSENGVLLSIPEDAFLLNGKPYAKQAVIQWQEAMDGATIIKSGLSTMAGDRMLETQGMFGIQAFTPDGKRLEVSSKNGIYVQVPVDEYKSGMQLFEGKKNAEGVIDWQNPKPLMKIPVPVDMSLLDFYPVGYGDTLDHVKLRKDKNFRDSLYLSFEDNRLENTSHRDSAKRDFLPQFISFYGKNNQLAGSDAYWQNKLNWNCSIKYLAEDEVQLTFYFQVGDGINFPLDQAQDVPSSFDFKDSKNYKLIGKSSFNTSTVKGSDTVSQMFFRQRIRILTKDEFYLNVTSRIELTDKIGSFGATYFWEFPFNQKPDNISPYISPSKVLAFWNPKFNNTILATREFEKRMQVIHSTCDNEVLETYTKNLSQPLAELDAKIVQMGHYEFQAFAAEQVGALNPDNPHLKNLVKFYEESVRQLQEESHNNRSELLRKQQQWDREMKSERIKEQSRTSARNVTALDQEYNFNLKNVCKQLGKTVGFQIHGTGTVYNIDKYVMDATVARTSATITDPETGKTAQITYNEFSFEVENAEQHNKLYAYIFPSGINSYQRISGENGRFSYPLNNDMIYDLAIVGISEKGYSYFQQKTLKQGKLGKIDLQKISETELNASVEQLNSGRLGKPMEIKEELNWLVKEQKDYKEQKIRQDQAAFRERIAKVIFPCYSCDCAVEDESEVSVDQ